MTWHECHITCTSHMYVTAIQSIRRGLTVDRSVLHPHCNTTYNKKSIYPWPVHCVCLFSSSSLSVEYPFPYHPPLVNILQDPIQSQTIHQPFHPTPFTPFLDPLENIKTITLVFLNRFVYNSHSSSTLYFVL